MSFLRVSVLLFLLAAASSIVAQPVISSISPSSAPQGSAGLTLTVNGSNFTQLNAVFFDGAAVATNFVNTSTLQVNIPASALTTAGTFNVAVRATSAFGIFSNNVTFTVTSVTPTFTSMSPSTAAAGSAALTLTLGGTNFASGAVARFGGTALTTTIVSATQATATVPATLLDGGGTFSVVIDNPGAGGVSNSRTFSVTSAVPTLTAISPTATFAGLNPITLQLGGSGFNTASVARANGTALTTTFVSSTGLSAVVPASFVGGAGSVSITVFNPTPGGGTSSTRTLTVSAPNPTLASVSPTSTFVNSPPVQLSVVGTGFVGSTVLSVTGFGAVPTTVTSSTQLTATLPTALFQNLGALDLHVATPGTTTSGGLPFLVFNQSPVLASFNSQPSPLLTAVQGFLQITGVGFHGGSKVRVGAVELTVTSVSATQIAASFPAGTFTLPGGLPLVVVNEGAGGGTSNALTATFVNPAPVVQGASPSTIPTGSPATTVTITGAGFTPQTQTLIDERPVATTFVSNTSLQAVVPASAFEVTGSVQLRVRNPAPGGGASPPGIIAVTGPTLQGFTPASIAPLTAASLPVTLSLTGQGFTPSMTVRANGTPLVSIFVNATSFVASLPPTLPAAQVPGGVVITVTEGTTISSNPGTLRVESAPTLDNLGAVFLAPLPPAPGASFSVRVEVPRDGRPITLVADIAQTTPTVVNPTSGHSLSLGVGSGVMVPLADGLGFFGPADPSAVLLRSIFAIFGEYGTYEFGPLIAPSPVVGVDFTLQAAYLDPAAPLGIGVSFAFFPGTL